jgi:sulfotransferase family protein
VTRVLYLAGWGRSGSTILEAVLNQVPRLVGGGELKFVWRRGLIENRRCSCGTPFRDCPFWTDVLAGAFGGVPEDRLADLDAASARYRTRHLPTLLLPGATDRYARDLAWYRDDLAALYRAIAAVAGADVVVDSSKFPSHLVALLQTPGLDVRVVHIVRDPRAVAYSWQRDKADPDAPGDARMPRLLPGVTGAYWSSWNLATERIARTNRLPYLRLRYEDMIADPRGAIAPVLELAGLPGDRVPVDAEGTVGLGVSHQVSGNPIRFARGAISIRDDDEWTREMSAAAQVVVNAVTTPVRQRYGYRSARPAFAR